MAQTGYSKVQIYSSSTATNTPSAGNLTNDTNGSELAINITDGKLFYKDNGGVVQVLATKGGVGSSTTTQVLYNSSGLVVGSANMTFDGSTLTTLNSAYTGTLTGGTGIVNLGSGQFYKDASGNVGIGTSSPATKLNVVDSGTGANTLLVQSGQTGTTPRSNIILRVQSTATGRDASIQFSDNVTNSAEIGMVGGPMYFATGGLERMRIDSSGNVGIGTSSPGTQFNVYKSTATAVNIRPQNSLGYADFGPQADGSVYGPYASPAASTQLVVGTSNSNPFTFYTNGAERMRIDSSGNVGIGTSSPVTRLTVYKAATSTFTGTALGALVITDSTNTLNYYSNIDFNTTGASTTPIARIGMQYTSNGSYLSFGTSNSYVSGITNTAMTIDYSGNLLVGTTSKGSIPGNSIVVSNGYGVRAGVGGGLGGSAFNLYWTGSATQLWIDGTNTGTITVVSDYRLKDKVETQTTPALSRINQLRPVTYEFKNYGSIFKADGVAREGFIAHEVQAVIPSAVEGEKDLENQIQSLKLDALCSVMVKAIQEQQALITAQAETINALTARIVALETK